MQGFLQGGASLQCKASLWHSSPLNLERGDQIIFQSQGVCLAHSSSFSLQSHFHAG